MNLMKLFFLIALLSLLLPSALGFHIHSPRTQIRCISGNGQCFKTQSPRSSQLSSPRSSSSSPFALHSFRSRLSSTITSCSSNMAATTNMASAIPLAFLGYRTSQIMFWLFGAGLIFKLTTQKNPTDKDAPNWAHVVTSKEQEEVR